MPIDYDAAIDYDAPVQYAGRQTIIDVEVDWGNDGTWVTLGGDVMEWQTRSGRDPATEVASRAVAGRMTATLDNQSGDYSPENTGGANYGNILPGRPVRVESYYPYADTLWQGLLEDIVPQMQRNGPAVALLLANGPLTAMNVEVAAAMQTSIGTGAAITEVLDKASWSATLRDLDTGQTTMTRWWRDKVLARTALREIEATENGFLRETRDGKIAFEDRVHRFGATHQTSQATYSDDPSTSPAIRYMEVQRPSPLPRVYNEIKASVRPTTVEALATLWTHPLANTTGDAPSIAPGDSLIFWADAKTLAAARTLVGVDAWTTPTLGSGNDIEVWSVNDGTGTDLSAADIGIAVSALGETLKVTLTNNHATLTGYVTNAQARGTAVTASDPVTVQAEDSPSQTAYGLRTLPADAAGPWIPDTAEAQAAVNWKLAVWKDALPTLRLVIAGLKDRTHLIEALTRDVSDRLTVEATQSRTQLGLSGDYYVESVGHRFDRQHNFLTTLGLNDAAQWSDAWVLGTSMLGTNTRLFY